MSRGTEVMPRVSLVKGDDRRGNIRRSLELVSDEIRRGLRSRRVVIKPNFVSTSVQLASSHADQIRGILDFLMGFYTGRVVVAEAACGDTMEAYGNFGYFSLVREYGVELIDLNRGPFEYLSIKDRRGRTMSVRVSSLLLDSDNYLVSAARLKTHDTVVVTLSIKNAAMGGIYAGDRALVHQGVRRINLNISEIAGRIWPDLSVIDGFEGMEGDGPVHGTPVSTGIAISGTDPLAVDRVACEVMGVDFARVGYLQYCLEKGLGEGDLRRIEIVGQRISDCARPFRLHGSVEEQYRWREGLR